MDSAAARHGRTMDPAHSPEQPPARTVRSHRDGAAGHRARDPAHRGMGRRSSSLPARTQLVRRGAATPAILPRGRGGVKHPRHVPRGTPPDETRSPSASGVRSIPAAGRGRIRHGGPGRRPAAPARGPRPSRAPTGQQCDGRQAVGERGLEVRVRTGGAWRERRRGAGTARRPGSPRATPGSCHRVHAGAHLAVDRVLRGRPKATVAHSPQRREARSPTVEHRDRRGTRRRTPPGRPVPRRSVRRPQGRQRAARDPWRAPRLVHTGPRHDHPARALARHRAGTHSVWPSRPGARHRRPATPTPPQVRAVLHRSPGRAHDGRRRSGRGTSGRARDAERQDPARGSPGRDCAPARRRAGRGSHPEGSSATSVPTGARVQGISRTSVLPEAARSSSGGLAPAASVGMFHVEHRWNQGGTGRRGVAPEGHGRRDVPRGTSDPGTRNGRPVGRPFRTTGSVPLESVDQIWWSVSPSAAPPDDEDPRPRRRSGRRPAPTRRRAPACGPPRT